MVDAGPPLLAGAGQLVPDDSRKRMHVAGGAVSSQAAGAAGDCLPRRRRADPLRQILSGTKVSLTIRDVPVLLRGSLALRRVLAEPATRDQRPVRRAADV